MFFFVFKSNSVNRRETNVLIFTAKCCGIKSNLGNIGAIAMESLKFTMKNTLTQSIKMCFEFHVKNCFVFENISKIVAAQFFERNIIFRRVGRIAKCVRSIVRKSNDKSQYVSCEFNMVDSISAINRHVMEYNGMRFIGLA